jgi:ribosomal protein L32
MSLIDFVANYEDLSTDRGYQFKFHCDKCGNEYVSLFQTSIIGTARGLLKTARGLLGGVLGRVGDAAYEIQLSSGGKAHDDALATAVQEAKPHFRQCTRCGKWVCLEVCWNAKRNLCEACALDLDQELAAAQATAAKEQIHEKARATDHTARIDMQREAMARCPECGARVQAGRFCPECGSAFATKATCATCGASAGQASKFCPECGAPMAAKGACQECGAQLAPGATFCPECGHRAA